MDQSKFATIIITHFSNSEERSSFMRRSISSLLTSTRYPFELIVVDNGFDYNDSKYLLNLAIEGEINSYIRNAANMHFGYARNQALGMAQGDYIVIADNDIEYEDNWLEECIEVLEAFPNEKIYATPFHYPMLGINHKYHRGFLKYKNQEYELNSRAGSNCFVMRRKDFFEVGNFPMHRIAGSLWTNAATRSGYVACVLPQKYATDLGLRKGYDLKQFLPIRLNLHHTQEVFFNEDEHKEQFPELNYRKFI